MENVIENMEAIVDCVSELRQLDNDTARCFVSKWSEDELVTANEVAKSNDFRGVVSNICAAVCHRNTIARTAKLIRDKRLAEEARRSAAEAAAAK